MLATGLPAAIYPSVLIVSRERRVYNAGGATDTGTRGPVSVTNRTGRPGNWILAQGRALKRSWGHRIVYGPSGGCHALEPSERVGGARDVRTFETIFVSRIS